MSMSQFIMKLAARFAPAQRHDWAAAMQAEYEVMETGRIGWAIGCLSNSVAWRLRVDAVYAVFMMAITIATQRLLDGPVFWMYVNAEEAIHFNGIQYPLIFYVSMQVPLILSCIALGLWQPRRILMAAGFSTLAFIANSYATFVFQMHQPLPFAIHYMNLPPVAGEAVMFVICLTFVGIGRGGRSLFSGLTTRRA